MRNTQLAFHRLTYVPERDGVMVGRPDIDCYVVLPEDGAQLLRELAGGMPVADAAVWYESAFGEPIDIDDFVETVTGLGFVRGPGEAAGPGSEAPRVRSQALGRAMFSPLAWGCYALAVAATVVVTVHHPELRPRPGNVFFVRYLTVVQLVLLLAAMPGLFFHEWFHVMAGRRRGLSSRLGVSRRLFFAVFETELTGLLSLPRRQRYLPFAAGMVADVLFFCGLTLAAAGLRDGPDWLWRMLLAMAYLTLFRLAWQLCLFLRTDPYYILTTALGCVNLAEAASVYLRRKLRWKRRPVPAGDLPSPPGDEDWSPRDNAMAPWFAWLNVAGTLTLTAILGFGAIPVAVEFARRVAAGLTRHSLSGPRFWDAAVTLAVVVTEFGVLPLLATVLPNALANARRQENSS